MIRLTILVLCVYSGMIVADDAKIVFSTERWTAAGCSDDYKGFRVIQHNKTKKLSFYCGKRDGPPINHNQLGNKHVTTK